jgi:hypothetical protein
MYFISWLLQNHFKWNKCLQFLDCLFCSLWSFSNIEPFKLRDRHMILKCGFKLQIKPKSFNWTEESALSPRTVNWVCFIVQLLHKLKKLHNFKNMMAIWNGSSYWRNYYNMKCFNDFYKSCLKHVSVYWMMFLRTHSGSQVKWQHFVVNVCLVLWSLATESD